MRNVYDCVEAFEKLLDKEYHLVLGRKNKSVSLQINFDKKECFRSSRSCLLAGSCSFQWFLRSPPSL